MNSYFALAREIIHDHEKGYFSKMSPVFIMILSYYNEIQHNLYNTIFWVQANFRVSYPIGVITRVKCIDI